MSDTKDKKEAFQKKCSIIISLIASLLLINSLGAQNSSSTAAYLNASAINTYAFFQAKNIRQNDLNLAANTLEAIVETSMPVVHQESKKKILDQVESLRKKASSYESEPDTQEGKKELLEKAKLAELTRDFLMEKGPYFDIAGLLLQLAIILFSVVLITERRTLYLFASSSALIGTFLCFNAFFLLVKIPILN